MQNRIIWNKETYLWKCQRDQREEAVIRVAFYFETSTIGGEERKSGEWKMAGRKSRAYRFAFSPRENLLHGTLEYHLLPFISRSRVFTSSSLRDKFRSSRDRGRITFNGHQYASRTEIIVLFERGGEEASPFQLINKKYADRVGNWNDNFLAANAPGTMIAIPIPRIILNKERAEPQRRSQAIHFPRRYSPGILYGIRVPTELPVFPGSGWMCTRRTSARAYFSSELVDVALFNPCAAFIVF